jgi:flagellar biosynthesis protein
MAEETTLSPPETAETEGRRPLAVALREGPAGAPRVVAKGRGKLAEQILAIAFDRGVKVRNDADLAEILAAIEVDSEVPLQALAAVAEILTYVYRASAPPPAAGDTPGDTP